LTTQKAPKVVLDLNKRFDFFVLLSPPSGGSALRDRDREFGFLSENPQIHGKMGEV
jgi:hypothetical protein